MTKNNWFVILQQEEVEAIKTSDQLAVFSAIKSYTANGKIDAGISIREISKRSHKAKSWVKPVVDELIELGLVSRVGTVGHRGGMVQVYRLGTVKEFSVPLRNFSVPQPGTKSTQSNKGKGNDTSSPPISLENYDALMGIAEQLSDKHRAMRERGNK